jgi:hypothetical protein
VIINITQNDKNHLPLSNQARAVILGTLLGDGSLKLKNRYSNANLQIRHSETQKEYFLWKTAMLREITRGKSVNMQKPDGYSKNNKMRFASKALPSLTELHQLTHKNNKLRIKRKWLNQMTPLSLAAWRRDDGSLIGYGGRKGVFCTDGFDKASVKAFTRYLKAVENIGGYGLGRRKNLKNFCGLFFHIYLCRACFKKQYSFIKILNFNNAGYLKLFI